jgi:hypothetical protein
VAGTTHGVPPADDTRGLTLDDTPPTAAELGGATADGDGLTMAAITAASLGTDAAFEGASEPIVVAERVTLIAAVPVLEAADAPVGHDADTAADAAETGTGARAGDDARAVDDRERWLLIAERAFVRAAERGFVPGGELEDWLAAEREVDARLGR